MGMTSQLAAFHFLHPWWLLALPPLLALAAWLTWQQRRDGTWSRLVDSQLLDALRLTEGRRGRSPWPLIAVVWTLAVLALAGPSWERLETPAFRAPDAWVLVLDLSQSMSAADVRPDRVTRARYAISDVLNAAKDARVALVVFASDAHTVTPLTTDVATIRALLQPLAPGLMPQAGDDLAPALEEAARLLRAGEADHGHVIVLSDGFADPARAFRAAQQLRQQGAKVDVIGVGTEKGAPEPDGQGGFVKDAQGHTQLARMQTDELRRVAAAGGGELVRLNDTSALVKAIQSEHAERIAAETAGPRAQVTTWRNGGIWLLPPLLLVAACFARRGWV
ncbi:MAG TPA: VWA domain-containing protein [Steroidobacteraceae bacterium]|jgi:Ca-activated chloride channel family protein|nr:VWA domain-containing protein [Steroidobacteraceae bacterium]